MTLFSAQETLITSQVDGPTITAAGAVTCLPPTSLITIPSNYLVPGRKLKITAQGRISCVVTNPGTARFDVRFGSSVVFDTGALNLNVVAKVTVPWWLEIELINRAISSSVATMFGFGRFQSEAVVGSPLPAAGGNGSLIAPVGTPAVGGTFNSTIANIVDMFFTQTLGTGSMTLHNYALASLY